MSDTNYKAIVFTIKNLRKIEKADRLLATSIFGNNVIVGIDTKEGQKGLYFPLESQIGLEFAVANDLLRRKNPETGKAEGGMFDENRRVRAQIFRGERSMGFWIPIESLNKLAQGFDNQIEDLKDGEEILEFNGHEIAKKYIPRNTKGQSSVSNNNQGKKKESKVIEGQFRFHKDTAQLGKNMHRIEPDDLIAITYKYHGTSAIAANVLVKREMTWKYKLVKAINKLLGLKASFEHYDYLYASRTVVKNDTNHPGWYGEDLWTAAGKKYFEGNLKQGETIYYEIVGYTEGGKAIQKGYDYGCKVGEYFPIIYRITYTLPDNTVVELPWHQVEERAKQLGVKSALTLYYGKAVDLIDTSEDSLTTLDNWQERVLKHLQDTYLEKDCIFHPKGVPAEGICVRKEGLELDTFKLKSFRFLQKETEDLDKGEIDLETEQSQENEQ